MRRSLPGLSFFDEEAERRAQRQEHDAEDALSAKAPLDEEELLLLTDDERHLLRERQKQEERERLLLEARRQAQDEEELQIRAFTRQGARTSFFQTYQLVAAKEHIWKAQHGREGLQAQVRRAGIPRPLYPVRVCCGTRAASATGGSDEHRAPGRCAVVLRQEERGPEAVTHERAGAVSEINTRASHPSENAARTLCGIQTVACHPARTRPRVLTVSPAFSPARSLLRPAA
jgi:hypothetical protein